MEDWQYTFPPVSKDEWLRRIERDLKDRSHEDLQKEWAPGQTVDPFHHADDQTPPVALPDSYFTDPPLIMDWFSFSASDTALTNKRILAALQNGAQCLVLDPVENLIPDFEKLLENVHTDMIEVQINIRYPDQVEKLISERPNVPLVVRHNRDDRTAVDFFSGIQRLLDTNLKVRYVYGIASDQPWIPATRQLLEKLKSDYSIFNNRSTAESDLILNTRLNIESVPGFYQNILRCRVLQLCWLNLISNLTQEEKIYPSPLEFHIQNRHIEDPDRSLINASTSFLAAALAGVNGVCIHALEGSRLPEYYNRISTNIHHILNYESRIYKGVDPLKGSYFFDFYSKKWMEEILGESGQ